MELTHLTDEQIQDYLDGNQLPNEDDIETHLSECPRCQRAAEQYKLLFDAASQSDIQPALQPGFAVRVADRIEVESAGSEHRAWWERMIWSSIGVAAALALYFFADWSAMSELLTEIGSWQTLFSQEQFAAWTGSLSDYQIDPSLLAVAAAAMVLFGNMDAIIRHLRDHSDVCW